MLNPDFPIIITHASERAQPIVRKSYQQVSPSWCRGNKGLEELSVYLKKLAEESQQESIVEEQFQLISAEVDTIAAFFLSKARNFSSNESQRTYYVQSLEIIGMELKEFEEIERHFKNIATVILRLFGDVSEKVRFAAIGTLYNLLNIYSERGL